MVFPVDLAGKSWGQTNNWKLSRGKAKLSNWACPRDH